MNINEHLVTISKGFISVDTELDLGSDVILKVNGTVTQITDKDNQDGTINRVYTVKGIISEVMSSDHTSL